VKSHSKLHLVLCLSVIGIPAISSGEEDHIRLALLRGVPEKWDLESNFEIFKQAVLKAAASEADLLITPECWLDGYASADPESSVTRLVEISQHLENSSYLGAVSRLARDQGLWICFGFTSLEDGKPHNAAGLWNAEGRRVGIYRKTHLQKHDLQYAPGNGFPVYESPWGRLGILICADRRWPESTRVLRLKGARLILNPTYGFWNDLNEAMIRTRSYENELYFAFTHPRQGLVTDTKGRIVAREEGPDDGSWDLLITDLDLGEVDDHGHMANRRPEIYQELSEQR
jgi:predicted amidohydrolase